MDKCECARHGRETDLIDGMTELRAGRGSTPPAFGHQNTRDILTRWRSKLDDKN
jgi:hypothetical protein